MGTKPTTMWHADGDGRCHRRCEACESSDGGLRVECVLLRRLVSGTIHCVVTAPLQSLCPFAVLADVLALHERKPDEDHRCGTCEHNHDGRCSVVQAIPRDAGYNALTDRLDFVAHDDGPPWDCRFWRRR